MFKTICNFLKLFLLAGGMMSVCTACSLIGLPVEVAEDAIVDTEVIVEDVGEAL